MTTIPERKIYAEARERIETAQRHGWTCRLRAPQVWWMARDIEAWMAAGLSGPAAYRIERAARSRLPTGVRLSREEASAINLGEIPLT